jgi:SAM-dependent methyltransferase
MMDQTEYWNGASGARWVREQERLDAMLRPFGEAVLAAASIRAGEVVLDVGCGCGETSLLLADKVGRSGRVLGLDLSAPMLARAGERGKGTSHLSFLEGDASRAPLEAAASVVGRPDPEPADAPGPFSFADPARVEGSSARRDIAT